MGRQRAAVLLYLYLGYVNAAIVYLCFATILLDPLNQSPWLKKQKQSYNQWTCVNVHPISLQCLALELLDCWGPLKCNTDHNNVRCKLYREISHISNPASNNPTRIGLELKKHTHKHTMETASVTLDIEDTYLLSIDESFMSINFINVREKTCLHVLFFISKGLHIYPICYMCITTRIPMYIYSIRYMWITTRIPMYMYSISDNYW